MRRSLALAIVLLSATAPQVSAQRPTPVVGLPCEGCEAALEGLPPHPPTIVRLAPAEEPGEPLRLTGVVLNAAQRPQAGVIVYAYQTDRNGIYPRDTARASADAHRHGRLHAWAMTDAAGTYTFLTIRPGAYPTRNVPQHIHMHVIEPGCATYYIDDVVFTDDPRLTPLHIAQMSVGRGGRGVVTPIKRGDVWQVQRDIVLGRNVPGYRACTPDRAS